MSKICVSLNVPGLHIDNKMKRKMESMTEEQKAALIRTAIASWEKHEVLGKLIKNGIARRSTWYGK